MDKKIPDSLNKSLPESTPVSTPVSTHEEHSAGNASSHHKGSFSFGVILLLGAVGWIIIKDLPSFSDLQFSVAKKKATERVFKSLKEEKKRPFLQWVSLQSISKFAIKAVVVSEDGTFFEHSGINTDAIWESLLENIRLKRYAVGASTITQQVAKNIYLSREKTLLRKIREVLISWMLEYRLSKNEILELYFNLAEFGPSIYGVQAASVHYFSKQPLDLSVGEGAFLALLLPSPKKYYRLLVEQQNVTKPKRMKYERILRDLFLSRQIEESIFQEAMEQFPEIPDEHSSGDDSE